MTAFRYALILALVFLPASPFATTFPVTKTADTDDGSCDPDCSLREAIEAANANPGADVVPVPAGIYLLTLGQLVVSDEVSIAGAGQTNTIIDGAAADRVIDIGQPAGVVAISGVTIQNGYDASISTCGGGIRSSQVDLTLTNSTVSGNTTVACGGGIGIDLGNLTLTNSTVSGNNADFGGGIWIDKGALTLTNSTVSGNNALVRGGGIAAISYYGSYADDLALTNSTVSGNTAISSGGGIWNESTYGDLTLTNSTVSGNTSAGSYGGGIANFSYYGDLTLNSSTVSGNSANQGGAGISIYSTFNTLTNTIVADNGTATPNCSNGAFVDSLGYNLADDNSCGFTAPGDLVVADAMLGHSQTMVVLRRLTSC